VPIVRDRGPWRGGRFSLVFGVALVGSACGAITGLDDLYVRDPATVTPEAGTPDGAGFEPGPPDGASSSNDADAPSGPTCEAPASCKPMAPGWRGPFAVMLAGENAGPLRCDPPFVRSWERLGDLRGVPPPAECACSCSMASGSCMVTIHSYEQETCGRETRPLVVTAGACVETPLGSDAFRAATEVQVECAPTASVVVPPIGQDAQLAIGCSPRAPGGCQEDSICMPPLPPGVRLCVRQENESEPPRPCPPAYPSRVELEPGFEDTRGCSPCTCTPAVSCNFSYRLYEDDDCSEPVGTYSDTRCVASGADAVQLLSAALEGTCEPQGGTPIGNVKDTSASVLCCAP